MKKLISALITLVMLLSSFSYATFAYDLMYRQNVALGKSATATESLENYGWTLNNLTDGDYSKGYTSQVSGTDAIAANNRSITIDLDLAQVIKINTVKLYTPAVAKGFPNAFNIQVSTNGTDWTTVASRAVGVDGYVKPTSAMAPSQIDFTSIDAQYVRLNATDLDNSSGEGYILQFGEMEVYNDGIVIPEAVNVALCKPCSASETFEVPDYGWQLSNLTDGRLDYGYTSPVDAPYSSASHHIWLKIDLQDVYTIDTVKIYPRTNTNGAGFPVDFTIQTSTDDSNWTTDVNQTGFPSPGVSPAQFTFTSTDARYVLLDVTSFSQMSDGYIMQLMEMEVYQVVQMPTSSGNPTPTSTPVASPVTDGITSVKLLDNQSAVTATLADAVTVDSVKLTSASSAAGTVIVAVYGNANCQSKLIAVKTVDVSASDFLNSAANVNFNLAIPNSATSVKVMYWDSTATLKPIFDAWDIQ